MRRLLIIGCGDVALRTLAYLRARYRIFGLTHDLARMSLLRASGVVPIAGDLDDPASLEGLAGIAHDVLHSAPPPQHGTRDTRTGHLIATLAKAKSLPQHLVYISTSGVYGDCAGEWVAETRVTRPATERARRRVDAERQLRDWGKRSGVRFLILRAPGIYSERACRCNACAAGTAGARAPTKTVTAITCTPTDLARMAVAALRFGHAGRMYNASDDSVLKMGDYFDLVADHCGLPRPPRLSRAEASARIPPNCAVVHERVAPAVEPPHQNGAAVQAALSDGA